MNNIRKLVFVFLMILLEVCAVSFLFIMNTTSIVASANEVSTKNVTIGIEGEEFIFYYNHRSDAEYSYESSNTKIAKISQYDSVEAVSKGTAIITITETLNGVSTKVLDAKVTVVGATIDKEYSIGCSGGTLLDGRLNVNNMINSAKYTFKSSDSKIVKVDQYGNLDGIKYGSAYISVTETYKGKVTKLGKTKIFVVKPQSLKNVKIPLKIEGYDINPNVLYRNRRNHYKFVSTNDKLLEINNEKFYGKGYGKVKVNVFEIVNGKSKNIGYTIVEIAPTTFNSDYKDLTIDIKNKFSIDYFSAALDNENDYADFTFEVSNSNVISITSENYVDEFGQKAKFYYLKGIRQGKTALKIYEEFNGQKTHIATINITFIEPNLVFTFDEDTFEYEGGILCTTLYLDWENHMGYITDELVKEPYQDWTYVTFSSSNEEVVKIDSDGKINLLGEGVAIITAYYENLTTQLKITVER